MWGSTSKTIYSHHFSLQDTFRSANKCNQFELYSLKIISFANCDSEIFSKMQIPEISRGKAFAIGLVILALIVIVIVVVATRNKPDTPDKPDKPDKGKSLMNILKRCRGYNGPIEDLEVDQCPDASDVGHCEIDQSRKTAHFNISFTPGKSVHRHSVEIIIILSTRKHNKSLI